MKTWLEEVEERSLRQGSGLGLRFVREVREWQLRNLIREKLCEKPCYRAGSSCRERDRQRPTTWCRACVDAMMREVEADLLARKG